MQRPILLCLVILLAGGVVVSGCGGAADVAVRKQFRVDFTPEQQQELFARETAGYRIRQGDVLAVRDLYHEELDQDEIRVLPDGTATFLALDRQRVAGMTVGQLDSLLTAGYAERFRDPLIDVYVREHGARQVYVLGEVGSPGAYDYTGPGFSVLSAIAVAGGYSEYAQSGSVAVIRIDEDGYRCREMDLRSITHGESLDPAILDLRPYDIVYVSRTAIGDFAVFSDNLMSGLLRYTDFATDIRYLSDDDIYRR
jgi:protein involved in polysaccharide export with SLBB domain